MQGMCLQPEDGHNTPLELKCLTYHAVALINLFLWTAGKLVTVTFDIQFFWENFNVYSPVIINDAFKYIM